MPSVSAPRLPAAAAPPIRLSPRSRARSRGPPTMSVQNSAGIQTLLDAEREASKIVQKAREFRTKRVKEARDDAKKEIADYKAKKDEDFKKFEAEHSKGDKEAEAEASKDAERQINAIKEAGQKNKNTVVKSLLSAVFDVHPVPPSTA